MANEKRPIVLVVDGGEALGRAIALALAARGGRVVVAGRDERALGETVGEIAFGGGKARHVVGDAAAGAARAREVFGGLDVAVACGAAAIDGAVVGARVVHVVESGDADVVAARVATDLS